MKNVKLLCSAGLAALGWSAPALAQNDEGNGPSRSDAEAPILVTASREPAVTLAEYTGSAMVITAEQLEQLVGELTGDAFIEDVKEGLRQAPMLLRLSPYLLSLISRQGALSCA